MISPDENELTPENSKQRSDYTGNFVEDIDNSAELEAIARDPTIFPNSTRIYVEGQIHKDLKVPMREIRLSDTEHANGVTEKTHLFGSTIALDLGATQILKVTSVKAFLPYAATGS